MSAAPFEPVNMVEKQLKAAADGNADQQFAFEKFILDETLYVATPEARLEGASTLHAGTSVELINVGLADGRAATAIFTSAQRVAEAFGAVGFIGMKGRELFEMVRERPAILNPGNDYGVVWEPAVMNAMLGLPTPHIIGKDTTVMLGSPQEPPEALIARLRAAFAPLTQIDAAWLALATWRETQTQSWYVDVRTASSDHDAIRAALSSAISGTDIKGRPVDLIINAPDKPDGTGIALVSRAIPETAEPAPKKSWLRRIFG